MSSGPVLHPDRRGDVGLIGACFHRTSVRRDHHRLHGTVWYPGSVAADERVYRIDSTYQDRKSGVNEFVSWIGIKNAGGVRPLHRRKGRRPGDAADLAALILVSRNVSGSGYNPWQDVVDRRQGASSTGATPRQTPRGGATTSAATANWPPCGSRSTSTVGRTFRRSSTSRRTRRGRRGSTVSASSRTSKTHGSRMRATASATTRGARRAARRDRKRRVAAGPG